MLCTRTPLGRGEQTEPPVIQKQENGISSDGSLFTVLSLPQTGELSMGPHEPVGSLLLGTHAGRIQAS